MDRVSVAEARSVTYMSTAKERTQCDAKGKASVVLQNRVLPLVLPTPPRPLNPTTHTHTHTHTHTLTST